MRPGWLSIPAAHRNRYGVSGGLHASDDGCGHGERSSSIGDCSSSDLGVTRADVALFNESDLSCASGARVVLVELDSEAAALSVPVEGRVRIAVHTLPAVAQRLNDLENDTDLEFEILRLRPCSETCADALATDCRRICGEDRRCRVTRQLDKHGLDVALSAGRHAAERAKLAGVGLLIAIAPSVCPVTEWRPPTTGSDAGYAANQLPCLARCLTKADVRFDPYDALRCRGRPNIAALVGVAIAAAQMGIPFCLPDPAGVVAVEAAVGLNPGVRAWFQPILADLPGSLSSPLHPCSMSVV